MARLIDVFPNWMTGGIFSALQTLDVPWQEEDIATVLDLEYYGNFSGEKLTSPLIDKIITGDELTPAKITQLAQTIYAIYNKNWSKEWSTLLAQYDPIENYRMVEVMEDDETVTDYGKTSTRTDNLSHRKTGTETTANDVTDTRTDNLTDTETPNVTSTGETGIYGFNSSTDNPADTSESHTTGTDTTTHTGTSANVHDEDGTLTYNTTNADTGTQAVADTGSDTTTRNYELTRSGNIGVTTSQQMLQSERDLWMWNYFYDVVFPDVDRILTIPVYGDGVVGDSSGGFTPSGKIVITSNGTDINVYQYATADVNVSNSYTISDEGKVVHLGELITQGEKNIYENGQYDTTTDAWVIINVPNTYTVEDEGKVVHNAELVSQGSLNITSNGTYDTTLFSSITISVVPQWTVVTIIYDEGEEPITLTTYGNVTKNTDNISIGTGGGVFTNYCITSSPVHVNRNSRISITYHYRGETLTTKFYLDGSSLVDDDFYISFGYLTDNSHNEGFVGLSTTNARTTSFTMWSKSQASSNDFRVLSVEIESLV